MNLYHNKKVQRTLQVTDLLQLRSKEPRILSKSTNFQAVALAISRYKEPHQLVLGSFLRCHQHQLPTSSSKKEFLKAEFPWQELIIAWVTNRQRWWSKLKLSSLSMTLGWTTRINLITLMMMRIRFLRILSVLAANLRIYRLQNKRSSKKKWGLKFKLKKRKNLETPNKRVKNLAHRLSIISQISSKILRNLTLSVHSQTWQRVTSH